jgi:hypothetical protein
MISARKLSISFLLLSAAAHIRFFEIEDTGETLRVIRPFPVE